MDFSVPPDLVFDLLFCPNFQTSPHFVSRLLFRSALSTHTTFRQDVFRKRKCTDNFAWNHLTTHRKQHGSYGRISMAQNSGPLPDPGLSQLLGVVWCSKLGRDESECSDTQIVHRVVEILLSASWTRVPGL